MVPRQDKQVVVEPDTVHPLQLAIQVLQAVQVLEEFKKYPVEQPVHRLLPVSLQVEQLGSSVVQERQDWPFDSRT